MQNHVSRRADMVRIEVQLAAEKYLHEVRTDQFLKGVGVHRRGAHFTWTLGIVRATMGRPTAVQVLQNTLHMLDDDEALEVMMPKLRELEAHGRLRAK